MTVRTRNARNLRSLALPLTIILTLAACGGGSSKPTGSPTSPAPASNATTTTAAPSGPATAAITLTGTPGVTGPITKAGISCSQPEFEGVSIAVLATPTTPTLSTMIVVRAGVVTVRLDSGAGATYSERDFKGSGVTGFDAARGVHLDSTLTQTSSGGKDAASLGQITSIKGTVSCGGQTAGSSTIAVTGKAAQGSLTGVLSPVRVACPTSTAGKSALIFGLSRLGNRPAFLVISLTPKSAHVTFAIQPSGNGQFMSTAPGIVTATANGPTANGWHVDGTLTEQYVPAATAHTVHLAGDATCGATG